MKRSTTDFCLSSITYLMAPVLLLLRTAALHASSLDSSDPHSGSNSVQAHQGASVRAVINSTNLFSVFIKDCSFLQLQPSDGLYEHHNLFSSHQASQLPQTKASSHCHLAFALGSVAGQHLVEVSD